MLSGVISVTGQRDKLTHNELQLIFQLTPQGALELTWPLRIVPNWWKRVRLLYPCISQWLTTVIPWDEAYARVTQFLQPRAISSVPPATNIPNRWRKVCQPWRGDLSKAPQYPLQPLTDLSLKLAPVTYICVTFVEIIIGSATYWMLGVLNRRELSA